MTTPTWTGVCEALAAELPIAFGATPAADAAGATGAPDRTSPSSVGWLASMPVTGALRGSIVVAFDQAIGSEAAVREACTRAVAAFVSRPAGAGLSFGPAAVSSGPAPAPAAAHEMSIGASVYRFSVTSAPEPAAGRSPAARGGAVDRLDAVLDVELPLLVRFGRASVPLKTLSTLVAGSLVPMDRSADDPVELLIGDRVIARGDVIVVGGHYGVRITELVDAASVAPGGVEA